MTRLYPSHIEDVLIWCGYPPAEAQEATERLQALYEAGYYRSERKLQAGRDRWKKEEETE